MDGTIVDIMGPANETVAPNTLLSVVGRRMEGETLRSLIVVDGGRPVGVVRWHDLTANDAEGRTAADAMLTTLPIVHPDTPLAAAREQIHDVDLDLLPVTDQQGRLVGEVLRERLIFRKDQAVAAEAMAATTAGEDREHVIHLEQGMDAVDTEGHKVGEVAEIMQDAAGRITHVRIQHGAIRKHAKHLPIDLVQSVRGDTATLTMAAADFNRLPDIE